MTEENISEMNLKGGWQTLLSNPLSLPLKLRGRRWGLWLAMLFFFLLPWQTRYIFREAPLYEWGTLSLYGIEILGWMVIVLGALRYMEIRSPKLRRSDLLFLMFSLFTFLSIIWSPDKLIALQAAARLLEGVLLYIVIKRGLTPRGGSDPDTTWFIAALIAGAVIQALLGIYQFLTQSSFASTLLGMALHDPRALGTVVVEFADQRWLRAYGSLPHPNILGGYLAIALAVLLGSCKRLQEVTGDYRRLLCFSAATVLITGIFFSFSRSAWIVMGLIFISMFICGRKHFLPIGKKCFLIGYVVFLIILFRPLVTARVTPVTTERLEIKSRVERVEGLKESWALIKKHPLLGVGIGNYTQSVQRDIRPDDPLYSYQPVHNVFLLIWAELGVIGLLLFLLALYKIFKQPTLNALMLLCFIVLMIFDHYLWSLPLGVFLLWGGLGLSTIGLENQGLDKKPLL